MAEDQDNVVVVHMLTKVFRDFWMRVKVTAVHELDLEVRRREVFGLLGPNGSGKSTTIKMILGLLFPTRGKVSLLGHDPTDVAVKAKIGFLPEESYLYPFLNARETLDYYGRLFHQGRHERMRRVDMLLEMVGLSGVAYRRVGEYSKGMQRRIGLAQALINDPDLLILDEPTSGMDPLGARQFKDLIRTLAGRGKTVLVSSHLLGDVEDICDRVCILYGGRKRAMGTISELLAKRNFTQIITQELDANTMAEVRRVVAGANKEVVEVTHPRDRLEALFLRIVQEAQEQRVTTGGAVAGGAVAEFLRGPVGDGQAVVEELVAAAEPAPVAPAAAPIPKPAAVDTAVLEQLATAPAPMQTKPAVAPKTPAKVDRKVLDELLDKPSQGSSK